MSQKIIFDTDPGIDDALALLVACQNPKTDLVGATTVFGNNTVDITTRNALTLLEIFSAENVPVAKGAHKPFRRDDFCLADFVHGKDGLGNTSPKIAKRTEEALPAHEWIVETLKQNPGEITLVAVAPLTNLALALEHEPEVTKWVKEVVVMGGAINSSGNVTPCAEANIFNDPEAADKVFTADWPVTMLGLDVTEQLHLSDAQIATFENHDNPVANYLYRITSFYRDFYHNARQTHGIFVHDLAAVAYVIAPELFTCVQGALRVATDGIASGMTILDKRNKWSGDNAWTNSPKVNVALDVDGPKVIELLLNALDEYAPTNTSTTASSI